MDDKYINCPECGRIVRVLYNVIETHWTPNNQLCDAALTLLDSKPRIVEANG